MSARDHLVLALAEHPCCFSREDAEKLVDAFAHSLAEQQRAHISDGRSEASWHRHHLYGLAGQTFEAQSALDKLKEAFIKELAGLIDPEATS
jgi:hypothetical protein